MCLLFAIVGRPGASLWRSLSTRAMNTNLFRQHQTHWCKTTLESQEKNYYKSESALSPNGLHRCHRIMGKITKVPRITGKVTKVTSCPSASTFLMPEVQKTDSTEESSQTKGYDLVQYRGCLLLQCYSKQDLAPGVIWTMCAHCPKLCSLHPKSRHI